MTAAVLLLLAVLPPQQAAVLELRGVVVDAAGLPVPGALVSSGDQSSTTDARGAFGFPITDPAPLIRVRATGFVEFAGHARPGETLRIVLQPAAISEVVTVTASRSQQRLADTATATSSLPAAVILTSAALSVDDLLRSVPGFSLFRRSSSRVANPTTQGATLRGLAASGASRALVLADGVPLNDPFGGWVYWNRVPQAALDRIEVVRGGAGTDLYGHESLAGTVQLLTATPTRTSARVSAEGGSRGTARVSAYAGTSVDGWRGFVSGERFVFDGFTIVAPDERGAVDVNAGARHTSLLASAGRSIGGFSFDVRGNWLGERRENGTPLQVNRTRLWSVAGRADGTHARGAWTAAAHGGATSYRQSFSAVNAARTAESLTARQHVLGNHQGASAQWTAGWGGQALLIGSDYRRNEGRSIDRGRGGSQADAAAYLRATVQIGPSLTASAGARGGLWTATDAAAPTASHDRVYVMPRVSVSWSPAARVALSASWSAPGRTPTLNELYRDFQVGGTVTQANPLLTAEEARSFETGALLRLRAASIRIVGFWTDVDDAIANVTLTSGEQIVRQRMNAGAVRARGVEIETEWRPARGVSTIASAAVFDSVFTASPEPGLTGRRVPQVPRWQAAASVRLTPGRASATLDWRAVGPQFDDDRNQFLLRRAFTADAFVGWSWRKAQPFIAVENLLDAEIDVGRTPVRTIGAPRIARAGLRLFF
jgi:outer membrane receptor protein involved in Fe transport